MSKKWEAVQTIAKTNDFPFGACLAKRIVASALPPYVPAGQKRCAKAMSERIIAGGSAFGSDANI